MRPTLRHKIMVAIAGWGLSLLMAFPVLWMALTAFKTEFQAIQTPPVLFFTPTLENFVTIFERANYPHFVINSIVIAGGSTLLALAAGLPAAYAMAFYPKENTKNILVWMLSTKMMPAVGVLIPIYLLCLRFNMLDTRTALIIMYTLMNLPIVVWMLFTFFKDVPKDILEAALLDGAPPLQQFWRLLMPLTAPGIASTGLLSVILSWNEAFWSINLSTSQARPLTAFIASFSSPEGLFWAKLSAASLLAIGPIIIFGWMTQKQLVRGLTFGAVK